MRSEAGTALGRRGYREKTYARTAQHAGADRLGFTREDETHWTVFEADMGQLDPSEVMEVEPLDD